MLTKNTTETLRRNATMALAMSRKIPTSWMFFMVISGISKIKAVSPFMMAQTGAK
jgi:hypothetical protein